LDLQSFHVFSSPYRSIDLVHCAAWRMAEPRPPKCIFVNNKSVDVQSTFGLGRQAAELSSSDIAIACMMHTTVLKSANRNTPPPVKGRGHAVGSAVDDRRSATNRRSATRLFASGRWMCFFGRRNGKCLQTEVERGATIGSHAFDASHQSVVRVRITETSSLGD